MINNVSVATNGQSVAQTVFGNESSQSLSNDKKTQTENVDEQRDLNVNFSDSALRAAEAELKNQIAPVEKDQNLSANEQSTHSPDHQSEDQRQDISYQSQQALRAYQKNSDL